MTAVPSPDRSVVRTASLPPEIYIPLVNSLYKDGRTLLTGTFVVGESILTTWWKTGEPLFSFAPWRWLRSQVSADS